jgi:hypothetical protein
MNLAHPTLLFWALLAIPIAACYLLKVRLRRVAVPTLLFWSRVFEQKAAQSPWRRLRYPLSLFLQLLLLTLLVFALADPFLDAQVQQAEHVVLVLDNSASMNATDGTPTRLDQARQEGQRYLDGQRFRDEMAIIAVSPEPQVVHGLSNHGAALRQALDAVPPTDGPTRVLEAVALARRLLNGRPNSRVVVLTDGCFEGVARLAEGEDVTVVAVGRRTGNVGITRFQARRSYLDPISYEVLAEVVNQSDEPVECRFELELNNLPVRVYPLKLPANGRWSHVFTELDSAEGGHLVGRIDRPDALAADNQAWAVLPDRQPHTVVLVTEGSQLGDVFLEKVLEANPLVRLLVTTEVPRDLPAGAVVVCHRRVPCPLPAGPVLVLDPQNACKDLWEMGAPLRNPIPATHDAASPLLTHVRLEGLYLPEASHILPQTPPRLLIATPEGDFLYGAFASEQRKVLVLTLNLSRGDLPLRTVFPILIANALAWLTGSQPDLNLSWSAGAMGAVRLPDSSQASAPADRLLWPPQGSPRTLSSVDGAAILGPLDQCGIWTVAPRHPSGKGKGESVYEVACNLASERESDLRAEPFTVRGRPPPQAGLTGRPLWFSLLAAVLVLAVLEWALYQRRRIG